MEAMGTQEIYQQILHLVGREIEVGLRGNGAILRGKVIYTMFDSFLIDVKGKPNVIAFENIMFLQPVG